VRKGEENQKENKSSWPSTVFPDMGWLWIVIQLMDQRANKSHKLLAVTSIKGSGRRSNEQRDEDACHTIVER
jgi:hypothetical protein